MLISDKLKASLLAAALSMGAAAMTATQNCDAAVLIAHGHSPVACHPDDDSDGVVVDTLPGLQTAADVFKQMPDSLLPYLTRNNRLDMIDFMHSGMKAEVTNMFDGKSEMTTLATDSLTIRLSEASALTMFLLRIDGEPVDSCQQAVCLVKIWGSHPDETESSLAYYSAKWRPLSEIPLFNESDKKRIMSLKKSTIVNCITKKVNK